MEFCLLRPIRTVGAVSTALFESLGNLLSSHRTLTRVSLTALSFTLVFAISQQGSTLAGPEQAPLIPESLLPQNVGIAVATDQSITIPFDAAMDPASVESALQVLPEQRVRVSWNEAGTELVLEPERLWRTDERYLVVVGEHARTQDGTAAASARRFSFTTQAAPAVADFQVRLTTADVPAAEPASDATSGALSIDGADRATASSDGALPPTRTATDVSATSAVTISFSAEMDQADVEKHFAITPDASGELTWVDNRLVFTPTERLEPGARYTISVIGAHDATGNVLGGKGNFSFIVQPGAQVTRTDPAIGARDVEPATVSMWFSAPMDVDATNEAFALTDTSNGSLVAGLLNWNEAGTQLTYTPDEAFAGGRSFEITLDGGAADLDGNAVTTSWAFSTKAAPVAAAAEVSRSGTSARTAIPAPAPASSLVGYALNQINSARAAYGYAPVVLDAGITAVASAHAWDQVNNGYYSHTSLNGASLYQRLSAGGVAYSAASENQCHYYGRSADATLNWCHSAFMAEPYPGHWNHIANILNPRWTRVGVGIADNGSHVVITWDFAN
jgi:uncharacterized protein YkwD